MIEDEERPRPRTHEIGMVLDAMSETELTERITLLEAEIDRLRQAIAARQKTRSAAEAMFKL